MKELIKWDLAGPKERQAVLELIGFKTNKGIISRDGIRIKERNYDEQSDVVKEIFVKHGILKGGY